MHFDDALTEIKNYSNLIKNDTVIIDVRAPIEFEKGSFPNAINIPLMDDEDRHLIGICYKEKGHQKAVELGLKRISGEVKATKINRWLNVLKAHPDAVIMCFRGGMRSKIVQQWLYEETGSIIPRVSHGYKAFRHFILDSLLYENLDFEFNLLAGNTGVGKTIILKEIACYIDLEKLAKHRGSSFGSYVELQPKQINFEHALAYALFKHRFLNHKKITLELEGKNIGKVRLPDGLIQKMHEADVVILNASIDERINITWQEYVIEDIQAFKAHYGENGFKLWAERIEQNISRLKKRLGLERTDKVLALFKHAINTADLEAHKHWIAYLLTHYYDPMYAYQREHWTQEVIFEGNAEQVIDFYKNFY